MDGNDVIALGYLPGKGIAVALSVAREAVAAGIPEAVVLTTLKDILTDPLSYVGDPLYGRVAKEVAAQAQGKKAVLDLDTAAPYQVWGGDQIEPEALAQMQRAVRLPVAVRGALMPDAHVGYGLPIGGVLATDNAVIPYAVGVDIACRMRMTIFDVSPIILEQKRERFRKALEDNTRFGTGVTWSDRRVHEVMDDLAWRTNPVAKQLKDTAWAQLGTSGSGNHFVEFGVLTVHTDFVTPAGRVPEGRYLALLSHSGSRRLGQEIANHYTHVAMDKRARLPKEFLHLAWLDLSEEDGLEYWEAMQLAGRYASANHAVIHRQIVATVRHEVLGGIENHHNFAWLETVDDRQVVVHRKGATPAGIDILGVIPGSMSAPGYVVAGRGNPESLSSAAHGAGRRMSRSAAMKKFDWNVIKRDLKRDGVELISGGLDEVPGAYKDIHTVMSAQRDLVKILAEFQPRLVKMDGSQGKSYRPED